MSSTHTLRSLGKLPRDGDKLPNMSTLFHNAKLFFKASVPVNIPALRHQSSHISTSSLSSPILDNIRL